MDVNLHTMMLQNVPSIELNRRLLQNEINSRRVAQILVEASQPDLDLLPSVRNNHSRTTSSDELPTCCNVTAAVNRSPAAAHEYTDEAAVTTARYGDVTRPAGGNANSSVNLNLARKRPRTTRLGHGRVNTSAANKEDFTRWRNRTASAAPTTASSWNASFPFVDRTGTQDEWNGSNTTSATDNSSQSVYCPAIPPGLREFLLCVVSTQRNVRNECKKVPSKRNERFERKKITRQTQLMQQSKRQRSLRQLYVRCVV